MKQTRVDSLAALARALGFNYQRVLRAASKGAIRKDRGRYDLERCRSAIESLAAQRQAGNAPDPILLKWSRRKKRAEALRLEKDLKTAGAPGSLPVAQVRKAWIANEMSWVSQLKTIARQLGGQWGGKLGKAIEQAALKLFNEMFRGMANDPILSGKGGGGQSA
jgi:hypothetical protein